MTFAEYVTALRRIIRDRYGCHAIHLNTEHVELLQDLEVVWQGDIETFVLQDFPKARECYAWSFPTPDGSPEYITVLKSPPATSPLRALHSYLRTREH